MWLVLINPNEKHVINSTNLKQDFHTSLGVLRLIDIKKAKYGDTLITHNGHDFKVLKPSFEDLLSKIKRGPQILTLKDISTIATYSGVNNKYRCVDAGTGCGVLASYLGWIGAKVTTYEIRDDFYKIAKYNIKEVFGVNDKVMIKKGDVYKKIIEKNLDLITLDLPEPWKVLKNCEDSLKIGGHLVIYLPTINQLIKLYSEIKDYYNLHFVKTIEMIERGWKVTEKSVRPTTKMLAHTGFLTFLRKW